MANSFAQLEKPREMSFRENRVRCGPEFAKLDERFIGAGSVEMTEAEPQHFVSVCVPPKPCTGGALWPPCIEEGPRDAQERVATASRPYRVFFPVAGALQG